MEMNRSVRPDPEAQQKGIEETLKEAQAALDGIENNEDSAVRESLAGLMEELNKLSENLRAMAEELAPTNGEKE